MFLVTRRVDKHHPYHYKNHINHSYFLSWIKVKILRSRQKKLVQDCIKRCQNEEFQKGKEMKSKKLAGNKKGKPF